MKTIDGTKMTMAAGSGPKKVEHGVEMQGHDYPSQASTLCGHDMEFVTGIDEFYRH